MRHSVLAAAVFFTLSIFLCASPGIADDRNVNVELQGYQEVPAVSTGASGDFVARISKDGTQIEYELSYSRLEGDVLQAHIHFGQVGVNGGIVVFLCQTGSNPDPTGLAPTCLGEGTVSGTLTVANMNPGPPGTHQCQRSGHCSRRLRRAGPGHSRQGRLRQRPLGQVPRRRDPGPAQVVPGPGPEGAQRTGEEASPRSRFLRGRAQRCYGLITRPGSPRR